jgi:uncharacterized membrane protein
MNGTAKRYYLIDGLRGLAVVNMVLYHFLWDLVYLSNIPIGWYTSKGAFFWQQGICWTFIFIAGFCWQFGKHVVRHGLIAFGCGALISAVTWIVLPQGAVTFGILTFLGSAMLLFYPLRPWLQKIPPLAGAAGSALLFALTRPVNRGYLLPGWELPDGWYQNLWTTFWGFTADGFSSSDYFSFFPWCFLFLTGFFVCGWIKTLPHTPSFLYWRMGFFETIGRHALIVYLLHQPILSALAMLFTL